MNRPMYVQIIFPKEICKKKKNNNQNKVKTIYLL